MAQTTSSKRRIPLYLQILAGMVVGMTLGALLGKEASAPFGELGKLIIALIKAIATPLLFLVIVNAILKTEIRGAAGLRLIGWAMLNASIALIIGLALSNLLQGGKHLTVLAGAGSTASYVGKKVDFAGVVNSIVPTSIAGPFVENLILAVIVLALLFGFGLRIARSEEATQDSAAVVERGDGALLRVTEVVLSWVIKLIPLAVFGVVTKAVGEHGFAPLHGLSWYVGTALLGFVLHVSFTSHAWL